MMLVSALFGEHVRWHKATGITDTSVTITCYAVGLRSPMALIPASFGSTVKQRPVSLAERYGDPVHGVDYEPSSVSRLARWISAVE